MSQNNDSVVRELDPRPSTRPYSAAWVKYYDQASRRRHRNGGYRRLRADAKRKRRVQLLAILATSLSVLALFGVFYAILTRAS